MSDEAIVWNLTGLIVVALLIGTALRVARAVDQAKRIAARLDAFGDLPVVHSLAKAETDSQRLTDALDQIEALLARAARAIAKIRGR